MIQPKRVTFRNKHIILIFTLTVLHYVCINIYGTPPTKVVHKNVQNKHFRMSISCSMHALNTSFGV